LLERDLQQYLFEHPESLFPGEMILEKSREYCVEGKRIDLLFRTTDFRYIIELKAVPLTREHIGQVVEYYGLMRDLMRGGKFKMVLVAPSIPDFRKVFLEEIGIRCVEFPSVPSGAVEMQRLQKEASTHRKREQAESEVEKFLPEINSIDYESLVTSVTRGSLAISHRVLRDSLADLRELFSDYEMLPIKMARANSPDVICSGLPEITNSVPPFVRGGAWWAYAFGHSDEMPKNDVPNISAMAMPWCLDLAINAELRTSQAIMKARIADQPSRFEELACEHGGLQFHGILKLEHQPRFYHWIPLFFKEVGTWTAKSILEVIDKQYRDYDAVKTSWVSWIAAHRSELSPAQVLHMRQRNQQPNLALRLVRPFPKEDHLWQLAYKEQLELFVAECRRMKPLIDFLR
jgi:hypothetical protein